MVLVDFPSGEEVVGHFPWWGFSAWWLIYSQHFFLLQFDRTGGLDFSHGAARFLGRWVEDVIAQHGESVLILIPAGFLVAWFLVCKASIDCGVVDDFREGKLQCAVVGVLGFVWVGQVLGHEGIGTFACTWIALLEAGDVVHAQIGPASVSVLCAKRLFDSIH